MNEMKDLRFSINVPHRFIPSVSKKPSFCTHCGSLIWGLTRQARSCSGTNIFIVAPHILSRLICFFSLRYNCT